VRREALIDAFDFEWTNKNIHVRGLRPDPFRCSRIRRLMAKRQAGCGTSFALLEPFVSRQGSRNESVR